MDSSFREGIHNNKARLYDLCLINHGTLCKAELSSLRVLYVIRRGCTHHRRKVELLEFPFMKPCRREAGGRVLSVLGEDVFALLAQPGKNLQNKDETLHGSSSVIGEHFRVYLPSG